MKVFITGVSSGIGLALAEEYIAKGHEVFGISRRPCPVKSVTWQSCDLAKLDSIESSLTSLLAAPNNIDLAILNAGILGGIQDLNDANVSQLKEVMDINLWANKVIIDYLCSNKTTAQIITLSSGAAVNGNRGWSGYSLSKAALNMMTSLYSKEFLETHFCAFAPGLVDTAMQDKLCSIEEIGNFSSLSRIQSARGTEGMPSPEHLAKKLPKLFEELKSRYTSGRFIDIRKMA
ncbi:SDR family NAD(P)-dependent oxidoreductase [Lentisphaera profundi]|uniref:SDR family NAD(P)-dependent oxidoreductase n=1 Tax=Lentisphaera profundi TaxID=1658616 RepID=A0ABY7VWM5_9BACT|nr:SDR family NAD(P)-dependent oxidoreductase [Lentisphaera profundi]WDE98311.1 SDR family NAD(P)-dependent oxidoreductase [Lentisphaera profundi]